MIIAAENEKASQSRMFDELDEDEETSIRMEDIERLAESSTTANDDDFTVELDRLLAAVQSQARDGNDKVDVDALEKALASRAALTVVDEDALPRLNPDGTLAQEDDVDPVRLESDTPVEPLDLMRREYLVKEVLRVRRHVNVTAKGRIQSFSSIVVVGDGQGTAGFGYGKALTPSQATINAARDAEKCVFSVPITDDHRLLRGFKETWDGATVIVEPTRAGRGISGGDMAHLLCNAFGITDVIVKAIGRTGISNVVRAFFKGMFLHSTSQREIAEGLGKKYFDRRRDYRYRSNNASRSPAGAWSPTTREGPYAGEAPVKQPVARTSQRATRE